jgi:hypothetical protein
LAAVVVVEGLLDVVVVVVVSGAVTMRWATRASMSSKAMQDTSYGESKSSSSDTHMS